MNAHVSPDDLMVWADVGAVDDVPRLGARRVELVSPPHMRGTTE